MRFRCYPGECVHHPKDRPARRFRPHGEMVAVFLGDGIVRDHSSGHRAKDVEKFSEGNLSARVFVGLNVGNAPKWTLDDVVDKTIAVRKAQGQSPDASFLAQRGVYTSHVDGTTVVEDSVQVILIDTSGTSREAFEKDVLDLAERLATELGQEMVIVEIQLKGVSQSIFGVTPRSR